MFKCKVCEEKDKRLTDQVKQIEFLKRLLTPNPVVPMIDTEMNKMLEGSGNEGIDTTPNEEQLKLSSDVEREAIQILTGTY